MRFLVCRTIQRLLSMAFDNDQFAAENQSSAAIWSLRKAGLTEEQLNGLHT